MPEYTHCWRLLAWGGLGISGRLFALVFQAGCSRTSSEDSHTNTQEKVREKTREKEQKQEREKDLFLLLVEGGVIVQHRCCNAKGTDS